MSINPIFTHIARTGLAPVAHASRRLRVPSAYRTEADQRAIDALPKGPSFHAQRPVLRGGLILHENQRPPKEPDIDQALRDLFREPWYKRLWSWLRGAK